MGWIRSGLVIPADGSAPYPLTGAGMVETDYEQLSFIVAAVTPDGWMRIHLKPGPDGMVWIHRDHLQLGEAKLSYQPWEELLQEKGDWLHFRAAVTHALRAEPSIDSHRITPIGLDHKLELLELRGDWMRVRVSQPDWTCEGPEQTFRGTVHIGWVKWRDTETGPWIWYYTRGC